MHEPFDIEAEEARMIRQSLASEALLTANTILTKHDPALSSQLCVVEVEK